MKNCLLGSLFFIVMMVSQSCEYDDEQTLYPQPCDTTQVTYTATIAPLVETRCTPCHNAEALESGIPLVEYNVLKAMVDAQLLLGVIRHEIGFKPMPDGRAMLPDCEILAFERWVADGALEN